MSRRPPGTEFTYTVNTGGRFETPEEFGNVVVRADPDGSQVLLRDVARIELGSQNYLYKVRLDGQPSALVQVFQLPDANGLDVAEQVFAALDTLPQRFPDDIEYVVSLDTTKPITAGIREIVVTLFQAVVLVILVVYIFLQKRAGHADSNPDGAGLPDRRFRGVPAAGLHHQHPVLARPGAGDRYRGG